MAETLFITPAEITATTIMGGNVDPDKYVVNIAFAQLTIIEPLLGSLLYDKIITLIEGDSFTEPYTTLYNEYVKPITKHEAVAEYIEVSPYMVENGGTFKHTADNREIVSKDEIQALSGKYHAIAQMYIQRFEKWICKNGVNIPEYQTHQDEVNAQKVKVTSGWYFGGEDLTEITPQTEG